MGGDKPAYGEPSYAFGRPVLFSWPNGAFLCAYCSDQKKAELSAPYLAQFLTLLMEQAEVDEINLVVHSMGNRVLVRAIEEIAREHVRLKLIKKFRIVNAAADVARDEYEAAMAKAAWNGGGEETLAPQVTIYASQGDLAMAASWLVNGFRTRLGQIVPTQRPYVLPSDNAVTIDTNVVSSDLFGHGYYSANGNVIADMSCFFADRPIGSERAIAPAPYAATDGRRHYRFVAASEGALRVCAPGVAPLVLASPDSYFASLGFSYEEFGERRLRSFRKDCPDGSSVPATSECPYAPSEPTEPLAPPMNIVGYFDFGDATITPEFAELLEFVLRSSQDSAIERIMIVGHADRAEESAGIAASISLARAEAAKSYLVERGVAPELIEVQAVGADSPAKPTPPGVREPLNRRVELTATFQ